MDDEGRMVGGYMSLSWHGASRESERDEHGYRMCRKGKQKEKWEKIESLLGKSYV